MKIKHADAFHSSGRVLKNPMWKRWWLWIVVLGAFLFRLFIMIRSQFAVSFDEPHYLSLAGSLFERGIGSLFHPYWSPFYPACIALFNLLFHNLELAGRMVNMVLGSFLVLLIHRTSLMLFGKKEALFSALAVAFSPSLAWSSTSVMPETIYSMLGIGGIVTGWIAFNRKRWWFFGITGVLWGAAYLTKPEGVGFLMVYMLILGIVVFISRKRDDRFATFRNGAILVFGFLLLASSYLIYLYQVTGKWTLSTKGIVNQQMEAVVLLDMGDIKDPLFHLTADNRILPYDMAFHFGNFQDLFKIAEGQQRVIRLHVFNYAEKFIKNFYHLERTSVPQVFTMVFFMLCTLGLFSSVYNRNHGLMVLYLLSFIVFYWFLLVPFFHVNERYLLTLFPLCLIWFGKGILVLNMWILENMKKIFSKLRSRQLIRISWIIIVLWILIFHFIPEFAKVASIRKYNKDMWVQPVELKEAGIWLKTRFGRPPVLMSLNKAVDFYAGQYDMKKGASFSYDSIDRNVQYARFRGVEYVVFSSRYLGWFPNLKPLVESQNPCSGLERVYSKTDPVGIQTVIYRIVSEKR